MGSAYAFYPNNLICLIISCTFNTGSVVFLRFCYWVYLSPVRFDVAASEL